MSKDHETFTQVETETKEPETKEPEETNNNKPKAKESKLKAELRQYQKKTLDAYGKAGVANKIPYDIHGKLYNKNQLNDFLRKVKEDEQPIQKIIMTMKRIPKLEYDKDGKPHKKDYLEVNSEIRGVDWLGNSMRVFEIFDGFHWEPQFRTTYTRDYETGDMIPNKQYQGDKKVWDIPLDDKNRKKIIEDIINNSHGTSVDQIKFYYQIPDSIKGSGHRDDKYTYDQFINSSPEEMENLGWTRPLPLHAIKDRKGYMG